MEKQQKLEIGGRIRQLREQSRYKQQGVADKLNIGLRAYQRLEEVGTSRYERCEELAAIFEVDPMWIWDGREHSATPDLVDDGLSERLDRIEQKLEALLAEALPEALDESPEPLPAEERRTGLRDASSDSPS